MQTGWRRHRGFTIVELLIVIVVIGILAALVISTFSGAQQRAQNAQTQRALQDWMKALLAYKADKGAWPAGWACLGTGYPKGLSGTEASGAECRFNSSNAYVENTSFNNLMKPYLGANLPTPAFVTARSDDTNWRRGLMYAYGGGDGTLVYIEAAYAGDVNPCPAVSAAPATSRALWNGNTYCFYQVGRITDT